jgi:macrolide-specific efflux system membrane fusion protein
MNRRLINLAAAALSGLLITCLATAMRAETVAESALLQLVEQVDVPARTSGVLASVAVAEGSMVEVGDVLGQIDDRQAQMMYQRAAIELNLSKENTKNDIAIRSAQKALSFATAELGRLDRAATGLPGSISQSQIEESKLRVGKAEFELEAARHEARLNKLNEQLKEQELALSKHELDVRRITGPIPGIVVDVLRHAGEWVEPGDKVVRIVRIDRLRAEGLIHNDSVPANWRNIDATVSVGPDSQPKHQVAGKISFVSPEVNPVNGLVRICVEIENPKNTLKPGQRARITIASPSFGGPARAESGAGN